MEQIDKTRELETKQIKNLLWLYALPAAVSQIIASIYNIADRIFIGQSVGPLAIAGLAITFPFMNVIHAFGSLVGAGASARMSIVLGQKDVRWAEKILGNSMLMTFAFGILFVSCGYFFMDKILLMFGATADTIAFAKEYMMIVLPGMFFTTATLNLTSLIRASGYPQKSMYILAGGAILNVILDAFFILVFKWGIAGAAWATTISMTLTAVISTAHFISAHVFIRFRQHAWQPKRYIIKNITMIGLSPFSMNITAAGVVAILNYQLLRYGGDMAVGAYGIVNTILNFLVLLVLGICMGMQPIAGYNYGAGHTSRVKEVYMLTMKICVSIGIVGSLLCCLLPQWLVRAFTVDADLMRLSTTAIRYLTIMLPLICFTITNSQFFQSIDKPWIAIVTSLSRQIIFLVPLCCIIPPIFIAAGAEGLSGVWASCTISDVFGAILAAILLFSQRKIFVDNTLK